MTRDRSRKPPKRKAPAPRVIDDDLRELALVLDEQRLDKNAAGWFSVPWRDGWNAIGLVDSLRARDGQSVGSPELVDVLRRIGEREVSTIGYALADEVLETDLPTAFTRATLRCYQLLIARSDAGGAGYNRILFPLFDAHIPEAFELVVMTWRCRDALGFADERRTQAFKVAWSRGLYKAAYAV